MENLEIRVRKAFGELRRQGIVVKRNVQSCCQSCVSLDLADNVPVLWSFGGQGHSNVIQGNDFDYSDWGFNHSKLVSSDDELTDAGKRVLDVFKKYSLVVEWEEGKRDAKKLSLNLEESLERKLERV
jgi:hypothetical protein